MFFYATNLGGLQPNTSTGKIPLGGERELFLPFLRACVRRGMERMAWELKRYILRY